MEKIACPICSSFFFSDSIEKHANACLEGLGAPDGEENNEVAKVNPPAPLTKSNGGAGLDPFADSFDRLAFSGAPSTLDAADGEARQLADMLRRIAEQDRLEEERRRQAEDQDRRLAMDLWEKEQGGDAGTVSAESGEAADAAEEHEAEEDPDWRLALALMEEERRKEEEAGWGAPAREEEDRLLALALMEEERKADEEARRAKERQTAFDRAVSLVKEEAQSEADRKLAAALWEKQELERRLEEAERKASHMEHAAPAEGPHVTLAGIEYPPYWDPQVRPVEIFDVRSDTAEFRRVSSAFLGTLGKGGSIQRLKRVQNKKLWMFYFLRRQVVAAERYNDPNENYMFHGSRASAYDTITSEGFDHRVANMGGAIGAGVYFATHASTSTGYLGGSHRGSCRMLYCRVTLGDIGKGKVGIRRPPEKSKGALYHSVGRITSDSPGMAVVFDNTQAYPEYIIHFRM